MTASRRLSFSPINRMLLDWDNGTTPSTASSMEVSSAWVHEPFPILGDLNVRLGGPRLISLQKVDVVLHTKCMVADKTVHG